MQENARLVDVERPTGRFWWETGYSDIRNPYPGYFAATLNLMFGIYLSFGKNQFGVIWLSLVAFVIVYLAICSFRVKG